MDLEPAVQFIEPEASQREEKIKYAGANNEGRGSRLAAPQEEGIQEAAGSTGGIRARDAEGRRQVKTGKGYTCRSRMRPAADRLARKGLDFDELSSSMSLRAECSRVAEGTTMHVGAKMGRGGASI